MTVFFTADTHFGDHRTINIQRRPFDNAAQMDAALIANWNAAIGPEDEVWHLGDVARRPADVAALLARLNGCKHLLRGNNDPDETLAAAGWASVGDYAELSLDERALVLCHYPFRSWNGQLAARSTFTATAMAGSNQCRDSSTLASTRAASRR